MASITPQSIPAGTDPVSSSLEYLIGQFIGVAGRLRSSRITTGLGLNHCEECQGEWLVSEPERHASGCLVASLAAAGRDLVIHESARLAGDKPDERGSAELVEGAGAAVEERPRFACEFGEPWGCVQCQGPHGAYIATRDGVWVGGYRRQVMRRVVACVNFCAGVPTEDLEKTRPMAEELRAQGVSIDGLFGGKGGAK